MKYTKVRFNVKRIVKLYKDGKNVSQIAQAIGYPAGHGNNRTHAAAGKSGRTNRPASESADQITTAGATLSVQN
jgi:hypothetical protein